MKSLRLITPLFLTIVSLPFLLTGCNRSGDTGATTDTTTTNAPAATDTNAAPAATAPAPATNTQSTVNTNSMPAK
jgi:hypothetical protein